MRSSVGMKSEINKRKTLLGYNRHEALTGILFALPWILGFLLFTAYPIGASLFYSFTNYNSFTITRIGFFNFANVFRDVFVADAFKNTLIFVFINVPISTVLGIAFGNSIYLFMAVVV